MEGASGSRGWNLFILPQQIDNWNNHSVYDCNCFDKSKMYYFSLLLFKLKIIIYNLAIDYISYSNSFHVCLAVKPGQFCEPKP